MARMKMNTLYLSERDIELVQRLQLVYGSNKSEAIRQTIRLHAFRLEEQGKLPELPEPKKETSTP